MHIQGKKYCFKCAELRPMDQFYRHPMMKDGHLNKCIPCTRRDAKARHHRLMQTDKAWALKERERSRLKPHNARIYLGVQKRWRANNKNKVAAQSAAARAVRTGKLIPPIACECCGVGEKLYKHHHDYSLPLSVVWVCSSCHGKIHRKAA